MKTLPRNVRRRAPADGTPTPPPVAVAPSDAPPRRAPSLEPAVLSPPERSPALPTWAAALLLAAATAVVLIVARALEGTPPIAVAAWRPVVETGRAAMIDLSLGAPTDPDPATPFPAPVVPDPPPEIEHEGYASIPGGVLYTPDTFAPAGSAYDLLIHFHGNTRVVRESAELAGLDAAVAVVNLGIGSGAYEAAYAWPGAYEALLDSVDRALAQRGLPEPRLRRVALSSWSAGYGAIARILDLRRGTDPLDAILIEDGIHTGWLPGVRSRELAALNPLPLAPFARAARAAAAGELLFTITHAEVDPVAYAGTALTADWLLREAARGPVARVPFDAAPPHLALRSAEGAVSKKLEKHLEPTTEARVGQLHVRGYTGNTREDHMAHLLQMGATVLPELAERWKAR